jgi:hypothetical protein
LTVISWVTRHAAVSSSSDGCPSRMGVFPIGTIPSPGSASAEHRSGVLIVIASPSTGCPARWSFLLSAVGAYTSCPPQRQYHLVLLRLRRLGLLTLDTSAELVNAILAMNAMTNPAFGHDIFRFTLDIFITHSTHKYRIGHFTPPQCNCWSLVLENPRSPPGAFLKRCGLFQMRLLHSRLELAFIGRFCAGF